MLTTSDHPLRAWPMLVGLLALLTLGTSRADQWYMKIDEVPGELTEGRLPDWTPVRSVGAFIPSLVTSTNPEPASFSCTIRKGFDRTSPALLERCGTGEPLRRVSLLYVMTSPGNRLYRITLDDVSVAAVAQDGGSGEAPAGETLSLNFTKIEWACLDLDVNGGTIGGLTGIFDRASGEGRLKTRPPFRAVITRQEGGVGVLVSWPGEAGHRYRILTRPELNGPWSKRMEFQVSEDGPASEFVPMEVPSLFMLVEEVD